MKTTITSLIFFISFLQTPFAEQTPSYSLTYDPKRNAMQDGRDAIKLAKETQRKILIEVGGDWCKWCHVLDRFLNKNVALKKQLDKTFVLLKINVSEENDNHEFLKVFPSISGYPHIFITKSNGELLRSRDLSEFYNNGQYSAKRFKEFLDRWAVKNKLRV